MDPRVQASLHKNQKTTLPRIYNYIKSTRFQDVNLRGRLYKDTKAVDLSHWSMPGEAGSWEQWTFQEITQQDFSPTQVGSQFGPTWSTHWFKVSYTIPQEWEGEEVRLRWISGTEAAVWSSTGEILQGFSSAMPHEMRTDFILSDMATQGPGLIYVEMAANRLKGGAMDEDEISPPNPNLNFTLSKCELALMDPLIYKLTMDLEVLHNLADNIDSNDPQKHVAMYTANQIINSIIENELETASSIADSFFSKSNGERVHTLGLIGNCHIDSAWLWPYSVTKRKAARSFSSQIQLMEDYPEHIFVASQAQQWDWVKQYYPDLFEKMKQRAKEGRFLPVGGTWVEMDGNIPSGESFIRQFFFGQKFYQQELGIRCKEFWLPDTFGYSAQIPAIMKHMDLNRFLTQKMSWSLVNKFPHHNFHWEGIDGSTVLAHFPPGESYSMHNYAEEALRTVKNLEDKGRVSTSAFLFGYGDGGGGPTQDMLERARRLKNCDGCPRMEMMTPDTFFSKLEEDQHNMQKWVGELFLELHNGTYTTQAAMKKLCRLAEFKMRDAELMLTLAMLNKSPEAVDLSGSLTKLEAAWKKILLNQFHDVLPGSGIGMIYQDATKYYQEAIFDAEEVFNSSIDALFAASADKSSVLINTLQWNRTEVVDNSLRISPVSTTDKESGVSDSEGAPQHIMVQVPAFGYSVVTPITHERDVTIETNGVGNYILSNSKLTAEITPQGQITSLRVAGDEKSIFNMDKTGNQILIYDDEPLYWDAWDVMDYHLETGKLINDKDTTSIIIQSTPLIVKVQVTRNISSKSSFTQDIILKADCPYLEFDTNIDWHEDHKILKVAFMTDLLVRKAKFDIQFGHLERPTNMNTSWDSARFEVCGHKWADISESGYGLTVLNDSKYGWMARGSQLTLSLLRSPKAPDDLCDMKDHSFKYALMPHLISDINSIVKHSYVFNNPLKLTQISTESVSSKNFIAVDGAGVVLHTVKPADDGSGAVVLRGFECEGGRSSAKLKVEGTGKTPYMCNGYEELVGSPLPATEEDGFTVIDISLKPFQIFALILVEVSGEEPQ